MEYFSANERAEIKARISRRELRAELAAQVMLRLLSTGPSSSDVSMYSPERLASISVAVADALIVELGKK